ncbi:uclacyanin 1-like [Asparagus officinalis]|uniref:uclacyanin 1-like n=1 Tax=Asparagus officinalis TaxID=4686 RepID=UPI00098E4702|nr:uclacyanin 1-like [Asparagus officinalis]
MATLRAFTGLITIAVLLRAALGADHVVGGAGGWELTTDLSSWASAETFKTGDTLTFSYGAQHSVIEVPKADYDSCSSTNAINSYTDGNTVIKLSSPGTRHFICGTAGHCIVLC